ncbi:MAG: hypothetical protein HY697_03910 [Deltaproteobacteria bacterium]|nr:hypothetical protein [Deltaproteobacteria bacterium]
MSAREGLWSSRVAERGGPLERDLFLYLLDLEVKRARRYQNFFCMLVLKLAELPRSGDGRNPQGCLRTLARLLREELRETDLLGVFSDDVLVALLPYGDDASGEQARSRFEDNLRFIDFSGQGFEVRIERVCFPLDGTDTVDLIERVAAPDPFPLEGREP